jgi:hypothetical protein
MSLKVVCERCGFVLYEGVDFKTPYEIIQMHDGRCPKCVKRLAFMPKAFEIRPLRLDL